MQGDIFSPLCFIIALARVMELHDTKLQGDGLQLGHDDQREGAYAKRIIRSLAPKKKVNKRAASTEEEEYKNHKQDMPWADSQKSQKQMRERSEAERQIAALPVGSIIAYTDGGDSDDIDVDEFDDFV
mgnify:CR=1 FL=1